MDEKESAGSINKATPRASFPCNVRDLGGLPSIGGGTVRHGQLLRSDDPGRGDRASGDWLTQELGVRHVIDLRHPEELERAGTLGTFVTRDDVIHHPVPITLYDALRNDQLPTNASEMGHLYARSLTTSAAAYATALRTIAAADGPVLVHCSHGKDRTGIVVALVLLAIGVEPEAIVTDFARTGENIPIMHNTARELGVSIGLSRIEGILLEAPADAMETFLAVTASEHGRTLDVLRDAGLESRTVEALRNRLTD